MFRTDKVLEYAIPFAKNILRNLSMDEENELTAIVTDINRERSKFNLKDVPTKYSQIAEEIYEIVTLQMNPIPSQNNSTDSQDSGNNLLPHVREQTKIWTRYEDIRLLGGIILHGQKSWQKIAQFVGNDRNRSQCSQRWVRCLDPDLSKDAWRDEEENRLLEIIATVGTDSWTKIAKLLGNRSDVQCRYRYKQFEKSQQTLPENQMFHSQLTDQTPLSHHPRYPRTRVVVISNQSDPSARQSINMTHKFLLPHLTQPKLPLEEFLSIHQPK
jgi:hypothetical protein